MAAAVAPAALTERRGSESNLGAQRGRGATSAASGRTAVAQPGPSGVGVDREPPYWQKRYGFIFGVLLRGDIPLI